MAAAKHRESLMLQTGKLVLMAVVLVAGIAGCAKDADKPDENKKRDMTTQQPVPQPLPPSGHTPK
jgi:hypothetical protein